MAKASSFVLETRSNGWRAGYFPILRQLEIPHIVTTKQGPDVQRVATHTGELGLEAARVLGLNAAAWVHQVHGGHVLRANHGGGLGEADALFSNQPGLAVVGKSADCPLILVADPDKCAVGFAHASWRSTVAGITTNLVREMEAVLGCFPPRMVACICPSAGPECYEVGPEVKEAALSKIGSYAGGFFRDGDSSKSFFDLWAANADALQRCGIHKEKLKLSGICTLCRNDLFPSYRQEGPRAGRFMAIIGLSKNHESSAKGP